MQNALIIKNDSPKQFSSARWGLVPHWAKDDKMAYNTINARSDSIQDKPTYKEPFKSHRCLIPADGFYEWKATPQGKIPYRFTLKDGNLFSFAGLFDSWQHEGKALTTFTIVTVEPNELVKEVHSRMPAILVKEDESAWLKESSPSELLALLKPYPSGQLSSVRLSTDINNARAEGPELVKPITPESKTQSGLNKFL
jgi:putative SOS response-associated peptidase YedK